MPDRTSLLEVRHVSVSIDRPPDAVYAFAAKAENLPKWAAGLGKTLRKANGEWIAEGGPVGSVKVRFTEPNPLGVLDHDVVLPSGATVHNAIRVVPNGTGSEVTFALLRQPDVSDEAFEADARAVERDLRETRETPGALAMTKQDSAHVHHAIDYIEIAVKDVAEAKRFYTAAFGWRFNDYGPDSAGIQGQGREVGGLRKDSHVRTGGPLVVLYSTALDDTLGAVKDAGGRIVQEPFAFPGGRRFHFADPSGNELAVWAES